MTAGRTSIVVPGSVAGATPYRAALDSIAQTIQRRARNYRNLVLAGMLIGVASLGATLLAWSPVGPLLLSCLAPAFGVFHWRDTRLLNRWRADLLSTWAERGLDLAALAVAVRANPALPRATVDGMLATLPDAGELVAEQRLSISTRRAIAAASEACNRERTWAVLLAATAAGVASAAVLAAAVTRMYKPLIALGPIAMLPTAFAWLRGRERAAVDHTLEAERGEAELDAATYARLVASLRE